MYRVGQSSLYRTINRDLMEQQIQQMDLNRQISTGNKVNQPSDAAGYSVSILDSMRSMETISQYQHNLDNATAWLSAAESAMDSLLDLLNRSSVLAEQMSTGTYDELEQEGVASEIDIIKEQMISLLNSQVDGQYIFGGSDNQSPAITSALMAKDRSALEQGSAAGHDTTASVYQAGAGDYRFRFTRDTVGAANTITIAGGNTLGVSLGLIDFNSWTHTQSASASAADIYTTDTGSATATTDISNQIGEELTWTADASAGAQTFRTSGSFTVTGAATVTVGADSYTVTDADDLVDQINDAAGLDYFAYIDSGNTVQVVHRGTGAAVGLGVTAGAATVDDTINLTELASALDSGVQASGVFHIDGAGAGFPPAGTDTVTIGDNTWTWSEIVGTATPVSAADYANLLSGHIAAQSDDYVATVSGSGTGASVQILARAAGSAGNVTLASSNADITSSGALYGGVDGSDTATTGRLYGAGSADSLRLGTTIEATVLEVDGADVTLRLRWYDDDGAMQTQDATISGDGSGNAVAVTGMGGLSVYIDSQQFTAGAVFSLEIGRYRGDDEALNINFSESSRMQYNWTAEELLGDVSTESLWGEAATAKNNTGTGSINLAGAYRGRTDRDFFFTVSEAGQVPGDSVDITVNWTGDDGTDHQETVTISGAGEANQVEVPGSDGMYIYLDNGTFDLGDSFHHSPGQTAVNVLDLLSDWSYQLNNGTTEEAQTKSQQALEHLTAAVEQITDAMSDLGTRQGRVEVRTQVITAQEDVYMNNLADQQEVDLTEAFLELTALQNSYATSLKVTSVVANLSLVALL